MPYPNEHSARIKDPALFKKGDENWGSKDIAEGIRIILGVLKSSGKWETQAYRFKANKFTVAQAKDWLKDHNVKYILFEPAKDSKSQEEMEGLERRILLPTEMEMRVEDGEQPRLVGYAAKYGVFTNLGWFKEKIRAGAFDEVIGKDADVRCLKNHNPDLILGRTKSGTLRLESNTVGLRFDNDVPDTTTGKDTLEEVRRGDLSGCSFSFIVAEQHWKYFEDDMPPERTIIKISRLFDVGPVTFPAYPDTTVAARSLEAFKASEQLESEQSASEQAESEPAEQKVDGGDPPAESRNEISAERQREIRRKYRKLGRMIARVRSAEV